VVGGAESDMELDLLGESESDSDESTHSHADNASIQRSAVTAATAGSDAGTTVNYPPVCSLQGCSLIIVNARLTR